MFVRTQAIRNPQAAYYRSRRAGTDHQAFFPRYALDHAIRIFRPNFQILVRNLFVINRGANRGPHMLPAFQTVKRRVGLQTDAPNRWLEFFQASRRAHKCSACAQRRYEMCDSSASLFPNFVSGSPVMCLPIRRIAVLIRIEILLGIGSHNLLHSPDSAVGPFVPGRNHEFCPESAENALPLL